MIRRSNHQDTSRWHKSNKVLTAFAAGFAAFAVLFAGSPAYADSESLGAKSCNFDYSVKVQSLATGNVQHYGHSSQVGNWSKQWSNGGAYIYRTNWPARSVSSATAYTSGTLSNATISCVYNP